MDLADILVYDATQRRHQAGLLPKGLYLPPSLVPDSIIVIYPGCTKRTPFHPLTII